MSSRAIAATVATVLLLLVGCGEEREQTAADPVRAPHREFTSGAAEAQASLGGAPPPEEVLRAWENAANMSQELGALPPGTTISETRYPDGSLQAQGFLCGGRPVGPWRYWFADGKPSMAGDYVYGGIQHGLWTVWDRGGSRLQHGRYHRGVEVGEWWYWHDSGQPQMHGTYHEGMKEGEWTSWHPNGAKASQGSFMEGRPAGRWYHWDEAGQILNASIHHHPIGSQPPEQVRGGRR